MVQSGPKAKCVLLGAQTGTGQPFTLPHIRVDLSTGECEERENICPRAEDIARLNEVHPCWLHSLDTNLCQNAAFVPFRKGFWLRSSSDALIYTV